MIHFVTGPINSGKTTSTIHLYKKRGKGDGFVALKTMEEKNVNHYEMMRLSTGEKRLLIIRNEAVCEDDVVTDSIGPYRMLKKGKTWVETCIKNMISKHVEPIYFDEIGILETRGEGFSELLREMLDSNLDLVLSVRDSLMPVIIERYHITTYHVEKRGERYGPVD